MLFWLALFCASIIFVFKLGKNIFYTKLHNLPLPPGPKASWFGKVKLPTSFAWRTYAEWRDTYGDMIYIYIFGNPILVLNSAQAISDLLEKRSVNYSSRPIRTMVVELIGWDWLFSSMPYGNIWKQHRNLFMKYFPSNGFHDRHRSLQAEEVHTLLRNLLHDPAQFSYYIRRTSAAIIVKLTYGINIDQHIDEGGDNYVTLADKAISSLRSAGLFGSFLVDYIPMLKHIPKWFPGAHWKRQALEWRKTVDKMANVPFNIAKTRMAQGNTVYSIVGEELEAIASGRTDGDEILIRNMAATTYTAGADTVVSSITSLLLAMCCSKPEVQNKAQRELDQLGRLPVFSDRSQLPYIECICHELLRWNPVVPLSLARCVSKEDEYRGYRIPKGTTVIPNVWAILHDPSVYPNPFEFDPERFMDPEKNAARGINTFPDAVFGFGRRTCPGRSFAFDLLWIAVASILAVFDISPPLNESGQPIHLEPLFSSGLIR
ncbi:cytochrome P450 [Rhodocollybia butyracea]|uniref:Cytochrome P450 n=1 Tax=Rhodocollybia butyracea TaxID=206335 RepID=A0A9P5PU19_9AGAR|nr:cytochrome P450 [Rhodocollybia butyracea]